MRCPDMIPVLGGPEEGLVSWLEADSSPQDSHDLDGAAPDRPYDAAGLIDNTDTNFRFAPWPFALFIAAVIASTHTL